MGVAKTVGRAGNAQETTGATVARDAGSAGVVWILRTGAQWSELPRDKFPPYQTCHRRFQPWVRAGRLVQVLQRLAEDLLARGQLDLGETFIDASFSGAKKGAVLLVQHAAAKGARSWQSRTAMVFLSPWGLQALRLMKPSSSKPRWSNGSHEKTRAHNWRPGL
jgi:transposase